ncbi:MAG: pilus assembly protein PilM [PVC group bacterium]|nr:pilus assembly protein PilM [PVC group bacterium]
MLTFYKSSVGIYIGPKSIQLAQLKSVAGRIQLTNFVHVDILEDEISSESATQESLIHNALRKAVNKAKIDLKKVNTVLMPGMVLLRYFQMPKISAEEMEEAVRFEARKYIPFRLEEAVTGFYILKDDPENRKVGILSLVTKEESIKNHLSVLNKVNINPVAVETASFALIRLLEYSQEIEKEESNVVIYIYAQRVNIVILKNGVPYFVRDISLGRREEWLDDETAALLLEDGGEMSDSRMAILENLLSELRISLEYYKKELGKEQINKVILCGEIDDFDDLEVVAQAAQEEPDAESPLSVYLKKKLNLPVVTIDPLKTIQTPKAKPLPYTFPMLAITVGAALRNLTKSTVEIDLFKARKKTSIKKKIFINKMMVIEGSALLISLIVLFFLFSIFVSNEKSLLEKEKQNRPKFMELSHFKNKQLKEGEKQIDKRLKKYKAMVSKRVYLTPKLNVLAKSVPKGIWFSDLNYGVIKIPGKGKQKIGKILKLSGRVFVEKKGTEIEIINKLTEDLKKNEDFFEGFKVIKTGSVKREEYMVIPVMGFSLQCSSDISGQ